MASNNTITIEHLITCNNCKKQVDNPCLLPCSHTYCRECIKKIASSNKGHFKCPQCDEFT